MSQAMLIYPVKDSYNLGKLKIISLKDLVVNKNHQN
jgi:hypothetical protein